MAMPDQFAVLRIQRVEVVRDARLNNQLLIAACRGNIADDQRFQQRMHLARLIIELARPEQLQTTDIRFGQDGFVFLPVVTL